jgi:hypothetical protein
MRLFVGEALRSRLTNTGNDLVPDSVNPVKDRFIQRINAQIVIVDTREKVAFKILVEPFYLSLCLGTADPAPAWRKAVVAGKGRQPLVWLPALTVVNPGGLHVVIEYLGGNPAKIPECFLVTGKERRAGHVGGKADKGEPGIPENDNKRVQFLPSAVNPLPAKVNPVHLCLKSRFCFIPDCRAPLDIPANFRNVILEDTPLASVAGFQKTLVEYLAIDVRVIVESCPY